MKFDLKQAYDNCPFRKDAIKGWLGKERSSDIIHALVVEDKTFSCHKHNSFDDEGHVDEGRDAQHCAGATILLEKLNRPNQWMRICQRMRFYDPTRFPRSKRVRIRNKWSKNQSNYRMEESKKAYAFTNPVTGNPYPGGYGSLKDFQRDSNLAFCRPITSEMLKGISQLP